jgi:hypothetical protein
VARIVAIVEGHGEVQAVPILVRRIAETTHPGHVPELVKPIRVGRNRFLRGDELERTIELAARQAGPDGCILVLLDADTACPRELAEQIRDRAAAARPDRTIRVVLAKMEYEAWFLAAAESIAGQRGIRADTTAPDDPESIRDAKGWLSDRMPRGQSYSETLDQPALTALFDMAAARRRARSFDKMWRDVESALG